MMMGPVVATTQEYDATLPWAVEEALGRPPCLRAPPELLLVSIRQAP